MTILEVLCPATTEDTFEGTNGTPGDPLGAQRTWCNPERHKKGDFGCIAS